MLKYRIVGGSKLVFNSVSDMLSELVNHMIDCESDINNIEIFNICDELHIKTYNDKSETRFVAKLNTDINEHNFVRDKLTVMWNNCREYKDSHSTEHEVKIGRYKDEHHYEYYYDNLHDSVFVWNQLLTDLCDLIDVLTFMAVI